MFSRLWGEKRFLSRNLLSRSYRGVRDAPREEKNHTNRSEGMHFTKPSRSACVHRFARAPYSRALSRHLFFLIIAREREPSSAPEFCSRNTKKRLKKTSKSALSSSDANTRFQNKRRVVVRKTYHGARLHRDGFADEGGLLDVSGSEHFFCEFFACKIVRSLALLYLLFLLFFSFLGRANEKTGRRKGSRKKIDPLLARLSRFAPQFTMQFHSSRCVGMSQKKKKANVSDTFPREQSV